jgi:hypothetical protein
MDYLVTSIGEPHDDPVEVAGEAAVGDRILRPTPGR